MKKEELAPVLRQKFRDGLSCGVEKVDQPGYENLWFVVPPEPPRKNPRGLPADSVARANATIERIQKHANSDQVDETVSYLFTRQEAVASSRMEGTWSTVDHVLTPGSLFDENSGKSDRASVLGYANALKKEFKRTLREGLSVFSTHLTCDLHKQVVAKDPHFRGQAGHLREPGKPGSIVLIGGLRRKEESIYNPTPPKHVRRCLNEVMSWMSDLEFAELGDAGLGMALPVRMALAHSHFEAVHPFPDGNGRVGRILLTLQMVASGFLPLYLSGYIEAQRSDYSMGLQAAQKKLNYGPIVEFISEAIVASRQEADRTKAALLGLPQKWATQGEFREDSTAKRALNFLISNPIFTVKLLQDEFIVSAPAAARAATQLLEKKIVRERTGYGRNRVFAAEEVIELLSRNFGDTPEDALARARDLMMASRS